MYIMSWVFEIFGINVLGIFYLIILKFSLQFEKCYTNIYMENKLIRTFLVYCLHIFMYILCIINNFKLLLHD